MTMNNNQFLQAPILGSVLHQELSQQQAHHAILSMAGEYVVQFRFEELYGLTQGYSVRQDKPQSAYETIIVVENTPTKIVLQHILVADGMLIKHWRQDWQYQPTVLWSYIGNYQWETAPVKSEQSQGHWLQTVWQVDDSPRYAGLGKWMKENGVVSWTSNETYRPLPRREYTTRDDYDVIIGKNRHVLTPEGWVHEQDNIKFDTKTQTALVREMGVNYYQFTKARDFTAAYQYWEKHQSFWQIVREMWQQALDKNVRLVIKQPTEGEKAHYTYFNDLAKKVAANSVMQGDVRQHVQDLIEQVQVQGKMKEFIKN